MSGTEAELTTAKAEYERSRDELHTVVMRAHQLGERTRQLRKRVDQLRAQLQMERENDMDLPQLSAADHFDHAVRVAMDLLDSQHNADGAVLALMSTLKAHPGTIGIITSRWQGDLMLAAMSGEQATRQVLIDFLDVARPKQQ
jgi:predicted nuclease with TOPRIM domain